MRLRICRLWAVSALFVSVMAAGPSAIVRAQDSATSIDLGSPAIQTMRKDYYAYDSALPLNPKLTLLDETRYAVRYHLTYESAHDKIVTAIIALPKRFSPPYPASVLVHGSGGDKDTSYIRMSSEMLTQGGIATISIDAEYHGERKRADRKESLAFDSYMLRDAWIQTVIDLRRAVDYLQSRDDIDGNRIGYLGFSMGGMLGATLGGVEPRIKCFLLAVPGGGLVNIVQHLPEMLAKSPMLRDYVPNIQVTPRMVAMVKDVASVIDPIYFVGGIQPRPLLILVAKSDEIIPVEASNMLIAAAHAREPEQVRRLPGGHASSLIPAVGLIRQFMTTNLGTAKLRPDAASAP
jgi:dienelactone hydrolase